MTDHTSRPSAEDTEALETLRRLRGSIDNIDAALVYLLAERFVHEAGRPAEGGARDAGIRPRA